MPENESILLLLEALKQGQDEIKGLLRSKAAVARERKAKPPTLEEVTEEHLRRCEKDSKWLSFDADKFFHVYESKAWIKANNSPILNWKSQMTLVQKDGWCERKAGNLDDRWRNMQ